MHNYLIMINPGNNRVYYGQSQDMALSELIITAQAFTSQGLKTGELNLAGIRYLNLKTKHELTHDEIILLSRLSFIFALFKQVKSAQNQPDTIFAPVQLADIHAIEPKISTLLKYTGKTNEIFTRMMINIALHSSRFNYTDTIHLLDPVAGKGTTLFEGAVAGFDVTGIEIEPESVHKACTIFKKYLEREKYKHTSHTRQICGDSKADTRYMRSLMYASATEKFKDPKHTRQLNMVTGDTSEAGRYFRKETFHLIVGDLPYGIAHSNVTKKKQRSASRSPEMLLKESLPAWCRTLRKGGSIVLAWNTFVLSKAAIASLMTDQGLRVLDQPPYSSFAHRVDSSIRRDIIAAVKD